MAKIIAIHSGGDWHDASAEYVVLKDGTTMQREMDSWREWYSKVYLEAKRAGGNAIYLSPVKWLCAHGSRYATDDELEVYED